MTEAQTTLQHILKRLESLDESIRGNGKPGLRAELSELQYAIDEHKRWHASMDSAKDQWWQRIIQPGIVVLYAALSSLLAGGLVAYLGRSDIDLEKVQETIQATVEEYLDSGTSSD